MHNIQHDPFDSLPNATPLSSRSGNTVGAAGDAAAQRSSTRVLSHNPFSNMDFSKSSPGQGFRVPMSTPLKSSQGVHTATATAYGSSPLTIASEGPQQGGNDYPQQQSPVPQFRPETNASFDMVRGTDDSSGVCSTGGTPVARQGVASSPANASVFQTRTPELRTRGGSLESFTSTHSGGENDACSRAAKRSTRFSNFLKKEPPDFLKPSPAALARRQAMNAAPAPSSASNDQICMSNTNMSTEQYSQSLLNSVGVLGSSSVFLPQTARERERTKPSFSAQSVVAGLGRPEGTASQYFSVGQDAFPQPTQGQVRAAASVMTVASCFNDSGSVGAVVEVPTAPVQLGPIPVPAAHSFGVDGRNPEVVTTPATAAGAEAPSASIPTPAAALPLQDTAAFAAGMNVGTGMDAESHGSMAAAQLPLTSPPNSVPLQLSSRFGFTQTNSGSVAPPPSSSSAFLCSGTNSPPNHPDVPQTDALIYSTSQGIPRTGQATVEDGETRVVTEPQVGLPHNMFPGTVTPSALSATPSQATRTHNTELSSVGKNRELEDEGFVFVDAFDASTAPPPAPPFDDGAVSTASETCCDSEHGALFQGDAAPAGAGRVAAGQWMGTQGRSSSFNVREPMSETGSVPDKDQNNVRPGQRTGKGVSCFAVFSSGHVVALFNRPGSSVAPRLVCHRIADMLAGKVKGVRHFDAGADHLLALQTLATYTESCNGETMSTASLRGAVQQLNSVHPVLKSVLSHVLHEKPPDWRAGGNQELTRILSEAAKRAPMTSIVNSNHLSNPNTPQKDQSEGLCKVQQLLLAGEREAAVGVAMDYHLYAHAIIISMVCPTKEQYMNVIRTVVHDELLPFSPLAHAYCTFNELPLPPFAPPQSSGPLSDAGKQSGTSLRQSWVQHAALFISNFTRESAEGLIRLGDAVWGEGMIDEAYCCFLLAHLTPMGTLLPGQVPQPEQQQVMELLRLRFGILCGVAHREGMRVVISPKLLLLAAAVNAIRVALDNVGDVSAAGDQHQAAHHGLPRYSLGDEVALCYLQILWLQEVGLHAIAGQIADLTCQIAPRPSQSSSSFTINHLLAAVAPPPVPSAIASTAPPSPSALKPNETLTVPTNTEGRGSGRINGAQVRGTLPRLTPDNRPMPVGGLAYKAPGAVTARVPQTTKSSGPAVCVAQPPSSASIPAKRAALLRDVCPPPQAVTAPVRSPPPQVTTDEAVKREAPETVSAVASTATRGRTFEHHSGQDPTSKERTQTPASQEKRQGTRSSSLGALANFLFRRGGSKEAATKKDEPKRMIIDTEKPPKFDPVSGRYLFEESEEEKKISEMIKAGPARPSAVRPPAAAGAVGKGPLRPQYVDMFNTK
ncbi:unnamed protein product [Trypanosoma congolense IL3000]|uniref:WGS project CAEQ00000000 data, annotated contig 541 n=1 Tax=Trypanosoma congolense (strain IL3000) TaxID=1068625 RepID=F9WGS7_TRYCI|nr:unnamed protein product [Trypanosoma congolense IL3000]